MRTEPETLLGNQKLLIIYVVATLLFFAVFAVVFFVAFHRRKNRFLKERYEQQQRFENELAKSQLEIREQAFKNIAWELHDNVGQLLSVANIQLNMLMQHVPTQFHDQIVETKNVVKDTVQEIRSLSKTLNNDVIQKNGLITSLEVELERFNRLNFLEASLFIEGERKPIRSNDEIFLFRILQEFFSNVMKHAKANKLIVHLSYKDRFLVITAEDDGVGFNTAETHGNSGMETMKSRAMLLNATFELSSSPNNGTKLYIKYPYTYDTQSPT
ncbi:MAG: histidine kinase [Flavobacteriales bacterium]|nr:histidine kinase [Flavobacteriales bacterium]